MWSKFGQNQIGGGSGSSQGQQQGAGGMIPMGAGNFGPGLMPGQGGPNAMQMHYQQQQQQHQQQQLQMHQQQHQLGMGGSGAQMGMMAQNPVAGMPMNAGLMQQQQQSMNQQQIVGTVPQMSQLQHQQPQPMLGNVGMPAGNMQAQQQMQGQQSSAHPQQAGSQQTQSSVHLNNPNPGGSNNNMLGISQPIPHKEINIVQLSRLGQETVQDIASRFQEVFSALKCIQPTSHRDNSVEKKVQEYFRTIRLLFKRVRIIYEKCNDAGMDYTQVESLISYKDEPEPRIETAMTEEHRKVVQENIELIDTVKLKNRQLREVIDRTRITIWEINAMLAMRRS